MIRLNRAIALSGLCARRAADLLIQEGRVHVNGKEPNGPGMSVTEADCIKVDNKKIQCRQSHHYFVLHKPKGYVCSKKRLYPSQKLIYDLIDMPGLFSVGRLDKDTTGLILLTTDGLLSQKMIHPSSCIEKEYILRLESLSLDAIEVIKKGIRIDGVLVVPTQVLKIGNSSLKIVVMEGKNREIRRLCAKAGLTIITLERVRIGVLKLNGLQEGCYKTLKKEAIYPLFDSHKIMSAPE